MRIKNLHKALLAAALAGAVLLSGCSLRPQGGGGESGGSQAIDEGSPEVSQEASPVGSQAASSETPETSAGAEALTGEAVMAAYKEYAAFADYWYKGGNADAVREETTLYQEQEYCRYEGGGIATFAALEEKALTLMTREAFDSLQENIRYVDVDGALYGPVHFGSGEGGAGFARDEWEAVKRSEGEYELKVGHYYHASAFIEDAAEDEVVLRGETTALYVKTQEGWRFSSVEYASVDSVAG